MDLYEAIKIRRSIRSYKTTPVEPEKLARIWEAVRLAPSACNIQPWRFLVLKTSQARERLRGILQDWALGAPIIVVGLGNRKTAWQRDGESIHPVDVAIATEHLILASAAEGLGTCWICAFDRKAARHALNLESEWEPVVIIPLGYANAESPDRGRKKLQDILVEL